MIRLTERPPTNNYVKVAAWRDGKVEAHAVFPFNDGLRTSAEAALEKAEAFARLLTEPEISVWKSTGFLDVIEIGQPIWETVAELVEAEPPSSPRAVCRPISQPGLIGVPSPKMGAAS